MGKLLLVARGDGRPCVSGWHDMITSNWNWIQHCMSFLLPFDSFNDSRAHQQRHETQARYSATVLKEYIIITLPIHLISNANATSQLHAPLFTSFLKNQLYLQSCFLSNSLFGHILSRSWDRIVTFLHKHSALTRDIVFSFSSYTYMPSEFVNEVSNKYTLVWIKIKKIAPSWFAIKKELGNFCLIQPQCFITFS